MTQGPVKKTGENQTVFIQPLKIAGNKGTRADGLKCQRNAKDLGTSGAAFSSMYLGNAMEVAADKTRVAISPDKITALEPARIAVIDNFDKKIVDIDADGTPDISHGDLVERYIKTQNPDAIITRVEIPTDANNQFDIDIYTKKMNELADRIAAGEKIDAVNVSLASEIDLAGHPSVSPANIKDYKHKVRYDLINKVDASSSEANQTFKGCVEATERVSSQGVPVYIAAGNNSETSYNLFGIAEGTTQVGTIDVAGDTILARNSDVARYEQGEYFTGPIYDYDASGDQVVEGYDINDDNIPDIKPEEVSSKGKSLGSTLITGSSFSTSTAVGKDTNPVNKLFK